MCSMSPKFKSVASLEDYLGDVRDPDNLFFHKRILALDEQELFPEKACHLLDEWGLYDFYIPTQYGGKLKDYSEVLAILKVIARRDLTVAVAHCKTYLGAISIWQSGSNQQKHHLAKRIRSKEAISLGLTEKTHGSDLLANEVNAILDQGVYRLTGEKWLINNATRSTNMIVFARTKVNGGPRGFSLFFVEKNKLDPTSYTHCRKIKTLGIRGADISGIQFRDSLLSKESLIGTEGAGLEIILKALQVTRILVPGLSLGAADTALRLTMDMVTSKRSRGMRIFDIPYAQSQLVDAFLDLLICDCVTRAATRALHFLPEQVSIWSAVVKYFVPTTIDATLHQLSMMLGARFYLREMDTTSLFQKILRDHRIVSLFDGNTIVNLNLIGQQLRNLSKTSRAATTNLSEDESRKLAALFSLKESLPNFDGEKLSLSCKGQDVVMKGLHFILSQVESSKLPLSTPLIEALKKALLELNNDITSYVLKLGPLWYQSAQALQIEKRYATLFSIAICIQMWFYNTNACVTVGDNDHNGSAFFRKGRWLSLCIERLLTKIKPSFVVLPREHVTEIADELLYLYMHRRLFSITPYDLTSKTLERGVPF